MELIELVKNYLKERIDSLDGLIDNENLASGFCQFCLGKRNGYENLLNFIVECEKKDGKKND